MFKNEQGDRTEAPSRRRRAEARMKGHVARSASVTAALMVGASAGVLSVAGPSFVASCGRLMSQSLRSRPLTSIEQLTSDSLAASALIEVAVSGMTILGGMWLLACGANLLQTGPLRTFDWLRPRISRIGPLSGLARLFSADVLVRMGMVCVQVVAVAVLVGWSLRDGANRLASLPLSSLREGATSVGHWLTSFGWQLSLLLISLSAADYGWQRWRFERELRMTRDELHEEQRESQRKVPVLRHPRRASSVAAVDRSPVSGVEHV